jgi:hypothetical protein
MTANGQSVAIITLLALMMAWTSLPGASFNRSAEDLVMIETISAPPGNSMVTSVLAAP